MLNSQCSILIRSGCRITKRSSDARQDRTIDKTFQGRHVANQILRSGTAAAPNYAEARGAESRADFIHKLRIVQKELNETAVWLRIIAKSSLLSLEHISETLAENKELAKMISASIRTAALRISVV